MGVKSTIFLTRKECEDRITEILLYTIDNLHEKTPTELEDMLELLNDQRCGGQGFNNYQIEEPYE